MPMRFFKVAFLFFCLIFVHEFHRYDAQQIPTPPPEDDEYEPISTEAPETGLDEFSKMSESKKEQELNVMLNSLNDAVKGIHEKEHTDYLVDCAGNYTHKITFLEETYMTREYIEAHEDVKVVRDTLIEEKFKQVYLNSKSSFNNLVNRYNKMNTDQRTAEREAFENAMIPMYYESRQFKWQLFVRWLLETSFWLEDPVTSIRLKQLHGALEEFVRVSALKPENFVRSVLTDWDDATRETAKWPTCDGQRAYKEFLVMQEVYITIMKLRTGRVSGNEDAYGSADKETTQLADYCSEVLPGFFVTRPKIEYIPSLDSMVDKRYCVDAVPEEVREWNSSKGGRKTKKGKV